MVQERLRAGLTRPRDALFWLGWPPIASALENESACPLSPKGDLSRCSIYVHKRCGRSLIAAAEQSRGNVDVQCLSGLQADDQFELGPRRIGKSAGFSVRPARTSATTDDASRPAK